MVRFAAAFIALAASLVGTSATAQQIELLDFWSPQCGPCMQMKPIVHSLEQARYPIRQIDTTRDFQMSQRYNVSQIPCFVMLVNGQETERQVGATSSESLQQMFERAKDQLQRMKQSRFESPDNVQQRTEAVGPAPQPGLSPGAPGQPSATERAAPTANMAVGTAPTAEHAKLIAATVRLTVDDPQGRSHGTGTIVDTRSGEALVFTCGHLFRETQGKAPVKADLFELGAEGVRVVGHATGQVISYDLQRDVALVSIRPDRAVTAAPVASDKGKVDRGDRVIGIGCSNGNDPTVLDSRVTSMDRYSGPPNVEATGAPAIGRSGGGLFNSRGELVGICNNADPEGNEGIYAGLQSLHESLDALKLTDIYAKNGAPKQPANELITRGQEPAITPIGSDAGSNKASGSRPLSVTEQAALEEIMARASTAEVMCIIRPKDPGGQSEVIQLDSVSPEFVRALKEHAATKTR
jgi:S1-C subfamily serine protease